MALVAAFALAVFMTLFTDASRISLKSLAGNRNLTVRLLSTGMILTILFGCVAAMTLFGSLSVWEAGIIAAILAPTDAGLGAVIVSSPKVPTRIRQALNVEAGFNHGLSVPFLMLFIALALETTEGAGIVLMRFLIEQLGYGTLIGLGVGLAGGQLLGLAHEASLPGETTIRLAVMATVLLSIFAHGLSALPGITIHNKRVARLAGDAPEHDGHTPDAAEAV